MGQEEVDEIRLSDGSQNLSDLKESQSTSWNGTLVDNAKDTYVLMRNCNASTRWKYNLKEVMDENGGHETFLSIYEPGLGSARLWSDIYVSTWKEFVDNVMKESEVSRELEEKAMTE
ncbi:hypothetical protein N0V82_009957, partial [Gnomoniopsis sp. IMI 355080]